MTTDAIRDRNTELGLNSTGDTEVSKEQGERTKAFFFDKVNEWAIGFKDDFFDKDTSTFSVKAVVSWGGYHVSNCLSVGSNALATTAAVFAVAADFFGGLVGCPLLDKESKPLTGSFNQLCRSIAGLPVSFEARTLICKVAGFSESAGPMANDWIHP